MQTHTHKPWNLAPARRRKGHVPPPNGRGPCKFISGTIALFWGMPSPGSAWKLGSHRETVGAKLKENLGERPGVSHKGKIDRRSIEPFKFALVKRPWAWRPRRQWEIGQEPVQNADRRALTPLWLLPLGGIQAVRAAGEACGPPCALVLSAGDAPMPIVALCMASVIGPVSAFRVRGLVRMYQHRSCFSHRCTGPLG
jgi:hypothetical protein